MTASIWAPNGFSPEIVPTESFEFTATSSQTVFSIAPYTALTQEQLQVYVGATPTSAEILRNNQWSVVGTTVVLTSGAAAGSYVRVTVFKENPAPSNDIPNQAGHVGEFLSTNGAVTLWSPIPSELPAQAGNGGKVLGTNGSVLSWVANGSGSSGYRFAGAGYLAASQYAAFMAYYNSLPEGSTLFIDGIIPTTTPFVFSRRVNIICAGPADGFWANVGTGNDAITFQGNAAGLNAIKLSIYLYGPASACRHGIVFSRLDRSLIYANVRIGASNFAFVSDGCLINQFDLQSSTNYTPPSSVAGWGTQQDHLLVQKNVTYSVASNINTFMVNFEGCRNGIVSTAQSGEGGNVFKGCIEGLTGAALSFDACLWPHFTDLWLEANSGTSNFNACNGPRLGPGVLNVGNDDITFTNCRGVALDHYYGGYNIASSCIGTILKNIGTPNPARNICNDVSAVHYDYLNNSFGVSGQYGGAGVPSQENTYVNPYFDIWADVNPAASPPRGVTAGAGGAIINRFTGVVYPGNPNIYSLRATSGATGLGNLFRCTLSYLINTEWMSALIALYVPTGKPGVIVHLFNGVTYYELGSNTTTKDGWLEFRGSAPAIAGNTFELVVSGWDGSSYANSQVYSGGCNIVRGAVPPKVLSDHGRRRANVIGTIANTPDFVGQMAVVGTQAYLAVGNASSSDWKLAA